MNLEALDTAASVTRDPNTWEKVLRKLRSGEMPPEDEPRPDADAVQSVTRWIDRQIAIADRQATPDPGRVTIRRLNRTEYNNTVRDLLGLDVKPAEEFPQDDSGYGFDNIGDVLSVPPLLMERYLVAAERLSRAAVFGAEPLPPTLARIRPVARNVQNSPDVPADYDRTGLSMPNAAHGLHRIPVDGEYVVKVLPGGTRPPASAPVTLALWIDGKQVETFTLDPEGGASFFDDRQDLGGKFREIRLQLTAGEHWFAAAIPNLYDGLPPKYHGPNPSTRPQPAPRVFTPPPDATPERIERRRKAFEAREAERLPANDARINAIEIAGPYAQAKGPSPTSRARVFTCGHADGRHASWCGRKIVGDLARRAYRRPVTRAEVNSLLTLVSQARRAGDSFEDGISLAIQAMLVSPDFLFRIERGTSAPRRKPALVASHVPTSRPVTRDAAARHDVTPRLVSSASPALSAPALSASPTLFAATLSASGPSSGADTAEEPAAAAAARFAPPVPVSQHELASRLSYFLWASMPDARLRRLADGGLLRKPDVLAAEVRRMLRDEKARALIEEFGGQWLQVRALESAAPDRDRFPDFDDYLRLSMRRETELFFAHIVRADRSILDFLDARYTFINERLARHYGLTGVAGPEFRRVDLTDTDRGGIFTQASILTVSSYATRTSPVLRGKWILENLLDAKPADPPPGVANLNETAVGATASLREQLEAHRADPTCAACHRRMDPLGFGLEHYDGIGAWRGEDSGLPIDASGVLPDGRTFRGASELRHLLAAEQDAFTKSLTTRLLTYALGRGLEPADRRTVRMIARRLPEHGYRFSRLVLEIVHSDAFQMQRGAGTS